MTLKFSPKNFCVALILVAYEVARPKSTSVDVIVAFETFDGTARFCTRCVFVQHTAILPGPAIAKQLCAPVGEPFTYAHHVGVCRENCEIRLANDKVIGIKNKGIVGRVSSEFERLRAIVSEVHPLALVEFAGNSCVCEVGANEILGAIGGTGIDDGPGIDEASKRVKRFGDDVCFVLDDHHQCNGWARRCCGIVSVFCVAGHETTLVVLPKRHPVKAGVTGSAPAVVEVVVVGVAGSARSGQTATMA